MLRLRVGPHVRVARCFGPLYADASLPGVFHVPCCDAGQAVAFDLQLAGATLPGSGGSNTARYVTLQAAFMYSTLMPVRNGGGSSSGLALQRRLRVCTLRCGIRSAVYESSSINSSGCILCAVCC